MQDEKNSVDEGKTSVNDDVDPNDADHVEKIDREMVCCNILYFFFPKMFCYDYNNCYCF